MKTMIKFFSNLMRTNTQESSKRFVALMSVIVVFILIFLYTDKTNAELIIGEILSFILVLFGVATWETRGKRLSGNDENSVKND